MTRKMVHFIVPSLALIVAGGASVVFGIAHLRRELPVEAGSVTAAPSISAPLSGVQDQSLTALATAQAEINIVANTFAAPLSSPESGGALTPVFDIARIEPPGDAVIAGRAAPGASVELLRNGEVHDRVVTDQSGQFVMIPPRLPPGDYELTLRSRQPDGRQATSKQSVVVALQPNLKDRPVVALMTPDKASVVVSKPVMSSSIGGPVAVETIETESSGKLYVSGHSPPGAAVWLYLNDSYIASTTSAPDGRVAFTINGGVGPGSYWVRLDEVEFGSGALRSRAEVPFNISETAAANGPVLDQAVETHQPSSFQIAKRQEIAGSGEPRVTVAAPVSEGGSPSAEVVREITTTVVSRGDSLWRISRTAYGSGTRYTVIFGANHDQIRNPNRIYPGQIFVVPKQAH